MHRFTWGKSGQADGGTDGAAFLEGVKIRRLDLQAAGWGDPGPEAEAIRSQQRSLLARALAALGPEEREVLVLRELEELTGEEAAAAVERLADGEARAGSTPVTSSTVLGFYALAPAFVFLFIQLALVLRQAADQHAEWRLPELVLELGVIARNERRFIGFSEDDTGFDPLAHRGKAVVTTLHKAKGLEWDRVYLMSVNNYDFPSNQPNDTYIAEKWFVRDGLNLTAEALDQLCAVVDVQAAAGYNEGSASRSARLDYVRERLRLLYVGITRAKRELVVTWNSGRQGEQTQALPFAALQGWWQDNQG